MKRWLIRIGIVLALVGLGYFLKLWVWTPDPITVSVVTVERGRVEETVTNSRAGTVKARQRAKLSPEIGGRVVELPYRKGALVHAGDVLLRLNDDSQQAAVQMAERELAVVEVKRERFCLQAARAQREFLRHQKLKERDLVSTDLLDKYENLAQTTQVSCKQTQAEIARARSVILEAKAELAKTVLHAPFDGVVADLDIEVGEWTTPSPPACLFRLSWISLILHPFISVRRWMKWTLQKFMLRNLCESPWTRFPVSSMRGMFGTLRRTCWI